MSVIHDFAVQFSESFAKGQRCTFRGNDVTRVYAGVEPHDRASNCVKEVLGQAPIGAVGPALHVGRNARVQIHDGNLATSADQLVSNEVGSRHEDDIGGDGPDQFARCRVVDVAHLHSSRRCGEGGVPPFAVCLHFEP